LRPKRRDWVHLAMTDPQGLMDPEVPLDHKDRKEIKGRQALRVSLTIPILPATTTTHTISSKDLTLKKTFELPTSLPSTVPPRLLTLGWKRGIPTIPMDTARGLQRPSGKWLLSTSLV
jgi:hypothetical protein